MKFIVLLMLIFPFSAMAGEKETEAYEILKKYCLKTNVDQGAMTTLLRASEAERISAAEAKIRFGVSAELWVVKTDASEYGVYSMAHGNCGVVHKNLDFKELSKIAKDKLKVKQKFQEDESLMVSTLNVVLTKRPKNKPRINTKAVIEIVKVKSNLGKDVTTLEAIVKPLYLYLLKKEKPRALCTASGTRQKAVVDSQKDIYR